MKAIREELEKSAEKLAEKSGNAGTPKDALRYSQAVDNVMNAMYSAHSIEELESDK